MCLLFFTPLFLRLVPVAAVGGLWPVELPFQILFLGDLALPELLLTELPLLQEIIQQAIAEADCHMLFREVRVGVKAKGYTTVGGRVSRRYYQEKIYGAGEE